MKYFHLFLLICVQGFAQQSVRVACIGNGITRGYGISMPEKNAYPGQLQFLLGGDYSVQNFGVSGACVIKRGSMPYTSTYECKQALAARPDIVFIELGANDVTAENRQRFDQFSTDYKSIIRSFRLLPSHPRIILLLPTPSFIVDSTKQCDALLKKVVIPAIQQTAFEENLEVLDLHSSLIDAADLFPDQLHPSSLGSTVMARRLYEAVVRKNVVNFDIFKKIREEKITSSFYGYHCADFTFNQRDCKVVKPHQPAPGLPWIWRARFWGHEPQTEIALLERGFHLVYCDVAELFGNRQAIDLWNRFYEYMQQAGLAKKVVLEGLSRGGLYIYSWAYENPEKVACVYADAPVLDFKSWPGGKYRSKGNPVEWERFKKNFELSGEEQAMQFKGNPIDRAEQIARAGYPMLHVVGDADDTVPPAENTDIFEQRIKSFNGNITVIHKTGVNHHPHSLANPKPIVDFILRATAAKINFAAIPAPGAEYRSAAGWVDGADWWYNCYEIQQVLDTGTQLDVLFIGDSITQGLGKRNLVTYKPGEAAFMQVFRNYRWAVAGISGDRTQNVLWRILHLDYEKANPRIVVLTIGVNNFSDDTPEEIVQGIRVICDAIKVKIPQTKILLIGPLPAGIQPTSLVRTKYDSVHKLTKKLEDHVTLFFPDGANALLNGDGTLNQLYYGNDDIHLIAQGYLKWAEIMRDEIKKIINKKD